MGDTAQEQLYEAFVEAAGGWMAQADSPMQAAPAEKSSVIPAAEPAAAEPSVAAQNSSVSAENGPDTQAGSAALDVAETVFESGFGMVPLVKGLIGIFGGGEADTPPPLVKYAMPERQYFEAADTPGGIVPADTDQMGMPRLYGDAPAATSAAPQDTPSAAPQQIQVNVQAMDAQSFLDHSDKIAQAVRQAMLNLSAINDVVNEL